MKKSRIAISALSLTFLAFPWSAIGEPVPEPAVCVDDDDDGKARPLSSFIGPADPGIVEIFAGAGATDISANNLTAEERAMLDDAFDSLPRLHRDVLRRHLRRISFLDLQPRGRERADE